MNLLLQSQRCMLYDMDFNMLMKKARYAQPELGKIVIILEDLPDFEIPSELYVMPEDAKKDFITYHCVVKSGIMSKFEVALTERTYYTIETETEDTPKLREELRVSTSIEVEAIFDSLMIPYTIRIKNVSAGGIMFVSEQRLQPGMLVSFSFQFKSGSIPVKAHILRVRPTYLPNVYAYPCRFSDMPTSSEAAIRNYVFREDLRQKKSGRL